ncbi:hypothetical protein [Croceimicrobium hydrocarbonivorans]|uniref:Uncharacterized protein n=1 Tax=Croceimicrobium hydrocarbonivorans TaxID=2761580 RepID=A0A7H0VIQ0_9FLAO|nr:hypothetical protein [Croceimicrobium hydrocarbonivorans]QNR25598.1 hypothetical protein H4K34_07075 [Croceimicrobium hydrocarbonivorans]
MNIIANEEKDMYSFPAFVANAADLMSKYNDQWFHLDYLNSKEGQKAIQLAEQCILYTRPVNRICTVGGNRIMSPDNYIFIPLLTSNEKEALYKFNFLTFDRSNLGKWDKREEFIEAAKQFKNEGKWSDTSEFKFLDDLIKQMSKY